MTTKDPLQGTQAVAPVPLCDKPGTGKDSGGDEDESSIPSEKILLPNSLRDPHSEEFDVSQYKEFAKLRYRAKIAEDKLTDILKKLTISEQHSDNLLQKLIKIRFCLKTRTRNIAASIIYNCLYNTKS